MTIDLEAIRSRLVEFSNDDLRRIRQECDDELTKRIGFKRPKDDAERLRLKTRYAGKTEPCCECGSDYPRGDLIIDGEIYCESHRLINCPPPSS